VAHLLFLRPPIVFPNFVLRDFGSNAFRGTVRLTDYSVAPDTPPPKTLV
jgi:hypothetical protein